MSRALSTTAIATTKPTLTADTVAPSQIETMSFLKYVYLSLLDKAHFLQFYNLLLTQATEYNIFLRLVDIALCRNEVFRGQPLLELSHDGNSLVDLLGGA